MTDPKDEGSAAKTDRAERLARQLRANLARRKAQARSRRQGEADERDEGIALVEKDGKDAPVSGR